MPIALSWSEISIRLLCAAAVGALIGMNRSERGHAAGLRTSMLVSLAACIAMLQVNVLLPLAGRSSDSFVMLDLMRLPLGILSGMGFIDAGAILRRGNYVVGVTTAATMWLVTVVGLCFGCGQVTLGLVNARRCQVRRSVILVMGQAGIRRAPHCINSFWVQFMWVRSRRESSICHASLSASFLVQASGCCWCPSYSASRPTHSRAAFRPGPRYQPH